MRGPQAAAGTEATCDERDGGWYDVCAGCKQMFYCDEKLEKHIILYIDWQDKFVVMVFTVILFLYYTFFVIPWDKGTVWFFIL